MNLPEWFSQKNFFRPSEVAFQVSLSERTIRRHMSAGAFGPEGLVLRGSRRLITRKGLLHYIDESFSAEKK